jgi:hypothetical protein
LLLSLVVLIVAFQHSKALLKICSD